MTPTSLCEKLDDMTTNIQELDVNTSSSLTEKSHYFA